MNIIDDFKDIAARVNRAKRPEPVALTPACAPYDDDVHFHFQFMLGEQWTRELNEYFTSLAVASTTSDF